MEILQITKAAALAAYKKADKNGKQLLALLLGEKLFYEKITDRVKTFEDACEIKGVKPEDMLPYANPKTDFQEALNGMAMAWIIVEVINEGWIPDHGNPNQAKWEIRWKKNPSGLGLSFCDVVSWSADTFAGPRLCIESSAKAEYIATQFQDVFNKFNIIKTSN